VQQYKPVAGPAALGGERLFRLGGHGWQRRACVVCGAYAAHRVRCHRFREPHLLRHAR
jgi:hypothetical protein